MSTPPTTQASIEQLHRDMAALAEDMRSATPTATRAILLPFGLGAALALVTFGAVAFLARLV
jgi:hypothetical protein